MERLNLILNNYKFKEHIDKIKECEVNRSYCKHNLEHFLDVARIAYIIKIENKENISKNKENISKNKEDISKEIIYATALLHDIGRWKQYLYNIPHEAASAELAIEILKDCHFSDSEIEIITTAIREHRNSGEFSSDLSQIIRKSDKISRACYNCSAKDSCKWSEEKKNIEIIY